jgi:hypothetical protein
VDLRSVRKFYAEYDDSWLLSEWKITAMMGNAARIQRSGHAAGGSLITA